MRYGLSPRPMMAAANRLSPTLRQKGRTRVTVSFFAERLPTAKSTAAPAHIRRLRVSDTTFFEFDLRTRRSGALVQPKVNE